MSAVRGLSIANSQCRRLWDIGTVSPEPAGRLCRSGSSPIMVRLKSIGCAPASCCYQGRKLVCSIRAVAAPEVASPGNAFAVWKQPAGKGLGWYTGEDGHLYVDNMKAGPHMGSPLLQLLLTHNLLRSSDRSMVHRWRMSASRFLTAPSTCTPRTGWVAWAWTEW